MSNHHIPAAKPHVGVVALNRDVVIETDLHRLLNDKAVLVTTRIPLRRVGSVEHLIELGDHLSGAAQLLHSSEPATIAFGCTSGVAAIGAGQIRELITDAAGDVAVVDPLTAMAEGMGGMGATRIALVTPYPAPIADLLSGWFVEAGFEVVANTRVAKEPTQHYADIEGGAIRSAVMMAAVADPEGYAITCTDLHTLDLIDGLESELGRPVATSNQALAWAIASRSDIDADGPGALFST